MLLLMHPVSGEQYPTKPEIDSTVSSKTFCFGKWFFRIESLDACYGLEGECSPKPKD
jgi:hypothetical protein